MATAKERVEMPVLWKEEGNIGFIILNDPPSNAMTINLFDCFIDILDTKIKNHIKAIIIYGAGRYFSSGANLNDLLENIRENVPVVEKKRVCPPDFLISHYRSFLRLTTFDIPVIAAIKGVCMGSALELALSCDVRICSSGAVLGLPETTFGLIPGCGGIGRLRQLAGDAKALELILRGCSFSAEEALNWNIIDKVLPKKDVLDFSIRLAQNMINTK